MEQKTGANESPEEGLDSKPVRLLFVAPLSMSIRGTLDLKCCDPGEAGQTAAGEPSFVGTAGWVRTYQASKRDPELQFHYKSRSRLLWDGILETASDFLE